MSNAFEMSAPSATDQIDYTKHLGVRKLKTGKWGAAIRHPITKVSKWLGSYNNPKEAADAFKKKQLEYQSLAVCKTKGVTNRKSRRQGAKFQDLGIYEPVLLVSCDDAKYSVVSNAAAEETEDSLNSKMCEANFIDLVEMNSNETKVHDKGDAVAYSSEVTNQMSADIAEAFGNTKVATRAKRLSGSGSIYQKKSGRWQARICYRKSKFHVGVYSTYEEAEAAIDKKRQELDSVACVDVLANELVNRELACNPTPEKQQSIITPCGDEELAQVVTNADAAIGVKRLAGSGSISQKGGKWQAFMPSAKSRDYLGLYNTYKEAEAAVHQKSQDLDSVTQVEMVAEEDRTTKTSHESVALVTKGTGSVGTYGTAEQAFEVLNRKRREFALLKGADKKCKQTVDISEEELQAQSGTTANCEVELIECKEDETALAIKSQDIECGDCSVSVEDIQAPCSSFDNGVINSNGQLIGEFSRLDEDLWLGESLDDDVSKFS